MRTAISYLFALTVAFSTTAIQANETEDEDDGFSFSEKLEACAACHGESGDKPLLPEYPLLAGQYKGYLANALRQYRDGQRTNPIMALQVEILELTDGDIDAIASHFASKTGKLHSLAE